MIKKMIFCLIAFIALERFCHMQTAGFRLTKASTAHIYPFSAPVEEPPPSIRQSFHYLGKGVQFYVFIGEDQQTILKLFKHHHAGLSTDNAKRLLPKRIADSILKKREKRVMHLFKSTQIALKEIPQETAVFYTHLNKSDHQLGKIALYDKLGIRHQLDLDQTEFILQKRAVPLEEKLNELFITNRVEEAISSMQKLVALIENRSKKGIANKDGRIFRNCGFLENEPLEIDVGSFVYSNKPDAYKRAKARATKKLLQWVETNYPENLAQAKETLLNETAP